jgi:hypothetical protein
VVDEPQEKRKRDTDNEAGHDRKVERGVFTAVDDVAWEAAEAEGQLVAEIKSGSDDHEQGANNQEGAAELAKRIHEVIIGEAFSLLERARIYGAEKTAAAASMYAR